MLTLLNLMRARRRAVRSKWRLTARSLRSLKLPAALAVAEAEARLLLRAASVHWQALVESLVQAYAVPQIPRLREWLGPVRYARVQVRWLVPRLDLCSA